MLTNYILSCKKASGKLPEKPVVVKTIVTTKLINKLCEKYGCELKNVLTGFKYIGEVILNLEKSMKKTDISLVLRKATAIFQAHM